MIGRALRIVEKELERTKNEQEEFTEFLGSDSGLRFRKRGRNQHHQQ